MSDTTLADGMTTCTAEETCLWFTAIKAGADETPSVTWYTGPVIDEGNYATVTNDDAEKTNTDDDYEWFYLKTTEVAEVEEEEEEDDDEPTEDPESASYIAMGFAAAAAVLATVF